MKTKLKTVNEKVLRSNDDGDSYYVDVTADLECRMLVVDNFLEAFDNLPEKAYKNPQLNVGPGGRIYGQVGDIQLGEYDGHKFVMLLLTPYRKNRIDYSIPNGPTKPLSLEQAKAIMSKMPKNLGVLIKSKAFYGTSLEHQNITLTWTNRIQMSQSDGFFIRPDTWYMTLEDNTKKTTDIAQMLKRRAAMQN